MASTKEIRGKIKSVQNTSKITKAMEMVAASKMRKAQDRMFATRPYSDKLLSVIKNIANASLDYKSSLLEVRKVKRIGIVVVTTDKGLAGPLNTNTFRLLFNKLLDFKEKNIEVTTSVIGNKGLQFLLRNNVNIDSQLTHIGDTPNVEKLTATTQVQIQSFINQDIDELYIVYSKFINTMKQNTVFERVLPLPKATLEKDETSKYGWSYNCEPEASEIFDDLLQRYLESMVYQAVVENIASEQSARMVAMKAASDNAKTVIDELQLAYNKTRQAAITKELAEIVGGAAAV